jgi:hypothetical protein
MAILSILLVIALLLKFDVVANVVDPTGKMKLQNIANDSFPILLGTMLVVVGIATIASVWVSIAFIAVGVVMIAQRGYQIYMRNKASSNTPG